MFLTHISIGNPVFATMLIVVLLVFGSFAYDRLGVDQFPNVDVPVVVVTASYPGATPEAVEVDVTKPIEAALNTVSGIEEVSSTSNDARSVVVASTSSVARGRIDRAPDCGKYHQHVLDDRLCHAHGACHKKNGILLVDFANRERQRGLSVAEAIENAGAVRFRPIVLTTQAMICGIIPLAVVTSGAGAQRAPMAHAVIGGPLSSTILTLIVVPVIISCIESFIRKLMGDPCLRPRTTIPSDEVGQWQ